MRCVYDKWGRHVGERKSLTHGPSMPFPLNRRGCYWGWDRVADRGNGGATTMTLARWWNRAGVWGSSEMVTPMASLHRPPIGMEDDAPKSIT